MSIEKRIKVLEEYIENVKNSKIDTYAEEEELNFLREELERFDGGDE